MSSFALCCTWQWIYTWLKSKRFTNSRVRNLDSLQWGLPSDVPDMSWQAHTEVNISLEALNGVVVCEHSLNFDGFLSRRPDQQPSSYMWRYVLTQLNPDASDRPVTRNFPGDGANGFLRNISIYVPYNNVTSSKTDAAVRALYLKIVVLFNKAFYRRTSYWMDKKGLLPKSWMRRTARLTTHI